MVRPGVHTSLVSIVRPGIHMSAMSVVIPGIHMSAVTIVMPCILMISTMTPWTRKAIRTLPSPVVLSAINATVAVSRPSSIRMSVNSVTLSIQSSVNSIALSIQMFVNSITLSIQPFVNSITLSIQPFVRTVLGHSRGKHYCYQQNTCTDNCFFHSDFLLFNELDFRAMYWLRRMKIELVYKDVERTV